MSFRCIKAVKAGKCKGAECCGIVPIDIQLYEQYKHRIAVEVVKVQDIDEQFKLLYTDDALCAFLDRESFACNIYGNRPRICRMYGKIKKLQCPYLKRNGKLRSPRETQSVLNKIGLDTGKVFKLLKAEVEEESSTDRDRPTGAGHEND